MPGQRPEHALANNTQNSPNWYVLLSGLHPPSDELNLAPGLSLRPLPKAPSVFDLASAGAVGFREWAALEPFAHTCTAEIESSVDGAAPPGYDVLNRAWLATSLLVLRGFTTIQGIACSSYSWREIAGCEKRITPIRLEDVKEGGMEALTSPSRIPLARFKGNVLDYHFTIFTGKEPRAEPPGEDDARWLRAHFETFNTLAAGSSSFRLALESAVDWRFTKEPRSAIARLWTGIEAIFGLQTELVFRVSLLAASLLEPRGAKRKARFQAIKKLYGIRSKAVHGGDLPDKALSEAVDDSFRLLKDLLVLSIDRRRTLDEGDFDNALFE